MLRYETIYNVNQSRDRIRRNYYNSPWTNSDGNTREGDELSLFTFGKQAQADSEHNLNWCLSVARDAGLNLLVVTQNRIQLGGHGEPIVAAKSVLFPPTWLRDYNAWVDGTTDAVPRIEENDHGRFIDFYTYRRSMLMQDHQGVYDVSTGRRIKNRRDIIERMWALGFAAQRGRPLTFARTHWAGNREELETITRLADRYWSRRGQSDAAKKMVSAYTSINRYCAWPGAW